MGISRSQAGSVNREKGSAHKKVIADWARNANVFVTPGTHKTMWRAQGYVVDSASKSVSDP